MIEARSEDPCASIYLARRKHSLQRVMRNADPALHEFMENYDKERTTKRNAMHNALRKQDAEKQAKAEKKKQEEALRKEKNEEEARKRKKLEEIHMGTDHSWKTHEFGTKDKFTAEHKKNMQEALCRVKMRSPELPEELEGNWKHFVKEFPERARAQWGIGASQWLHDELIGVLKVLGKYALHNPSLPSKKPRAESGGDKLAWENFVRRQMETKAGDGKLLC